MSPDGRRVGYFAAEGEGWVAVVDGRKGKVYDWIKDGTEIVQNSLAFSPDSRHVAYRAQSGGRQFVVVDGEEGKPYDWICDRSLTFSPDSRRPAYMANIGREYYVVVDGDELGPYAGVQCSITFSPDSQQVLYAAGTGDWWGLIVDGRESVRYDEIGRVAFSPDGRHLAYYASDYAQVGNPLFMVLDGREGDRYGGISGPTFSPDGRRLAYAAQMPPGDGPTGWFMVVDGKRGQTYAECSLPTFSPDSRQLAYVAREGEQWLVVVDGKVEKGYDRITAWPAFSPDSRHLAYGAQAAGEQFAVADGREGKAYDAIVGHSLVLSPDSRRLAYGASAGGREFVVLGEVEGRAYDALVVDWAAAKARILFDSATSLHYVARLGDEILLVEECVRSEAAKDAQGNPILRQVPTASLPSAAPAPIVGVFVDTAPMQLPSAAREEFDFTTIAYAPHDILIAAGEKADESVGVLYFLKGGPDGYEAHLYRYPGRGPIVLESLAAGKRVVTFRWGDGQPGFFDLENGAANSAAYVP